VQRLAYCTPPELREHAAEETQCESEEAVRLLYVASTRARDVLVVPTVGDERRDGWLAALHPAIYPARSQARRPEAKTRSRYAALRG
jgi:ATP-dependent helicase/nuclease subunit A